MIQLKKKNGDLTPKNRSALNRALEHDYREKIEIIPNNSGPSRKVDMSPSIESLRATPAIPLTLLAPGNLLHALSPPSHSFQNPRYTWKIKTSR